MMKRLLVCLLSLCMLVSMFPAAVYADEPVEGEIHHWDEGKVTKDPTCEEEGEMTYTCTDEDCGKVKTEPIAPLGHTPKGEYDDHDYEKPATCTEPGHEKYEHCANCGALIKVGEEGEYEVVDEKAYEIEPTGHNYVEVKAQDPTCVEAGWEDYVHCENPVYGWDAENKEWKPLYLDEDGNETFEQTDTPVICGVYEEGHEKKEIPATGHTPVPDPNDEEYKNRRCDDTEPRSVAAICAVCGETLEEKILIPIPDHTWTTVEAQAPTCTEDGWDEYEICSVCGAINTPDGQIPYIDALGHDFSVWVGATAGDCTHDGTIAGYKCSRCGAPDPDHPYEEIPAPGHKFVKIAQQDPTCTEPGVKAYFKCSVCGELFETDSESNKMIEKGDITDLDAWKAEGGNGYIAPLGHDFKTVIGTKASCVDDGVGAYKECTRCGLIVYLDPDAKVIPAYHHSNVDGYWPENYVDNKGTTHKGGDGEERIVADLIAKDTEWNDPANEGITYCIDPEDAAKAKEPTCTEDGYQPAKLCLFCGEVLEPSKVIDKLDHNWELETAGTIPTCTESGVSDLWKCSRCGETRGGDYIQPRNHKYSDGTSAMADVALLLPECDKDGHFAYSYCKLCGYAVAEAQEMVDERLHNEDQVVASLTAKTESTMPNKTPDKGHPAEFIVAKYNHKYVEDVRPVDPTCTETGIAEGATRCLVCGKYFNLTALKALGHDLKAVKKVAATCLESGNKAYVYCARCGKAAAGTLKTVTEDAITASTVLQNLEDLTEIPTAFVIAALGHDERPGIKVDPTCVEDGSTAGTYCYRCGMTLEGSEVIPAHKHSNVNGTWPQDYENAGAKRTISELIAMGTKWDTFFSDDYSEMGINKGITYEVTAAEMAKAKAPTCTEAGYDPEKICVFCGEVLEPGEDIAALGHVAGDVQDPVYPTCTEYGYHGGIHCMKCGNELSQEAVIQYLLKKDYKALEADGWIVIPTLDDPLGHNLSAVKNSAPDCTHVGYENYRECLRSGCDYTEGKILPALGHDWVDVPGGEKTAPTCLKAGTDGLHQCARCRLTEAVVVPALGHDVVTVAAKEPTCVDEGNIAYVYCDRCKNAASKDDYDADAKVLDSDTIIYEGKTPAPFVLAATGVHTWEHVDAVGATCKDNGHTDGQICSVCGQTDYTEIPADFDAYHEFLSTEEELAKIEWTVINPGDGTPGSGMRAKLCPVCGYVLEVEEYPNVLKGDVNMDGNVSPLDAQLVLQYYVGIVDTLPNMKAADFNEDGSITPKDAQAILNYYLFGDTPSSVTVAF